MIPCGQTFKLPEWRNLYESALTWDYNVCVPHRRIEQILGIRKDRNPRKYYTMVNRVRDELLMNDSRHLVNVVDRGYMVVHPREVKTIVENGFDKAHRLSKRMVTEALNTNLNELSSSERMVHTQMTDRVMYYYNVTGTVRKDVMTLMREVPRLQLNPAVRPQEESDQEPEEDRGST